ncbi:unnamed protein product [Polarella glacialis]|uniref:Uncharacterized protein n=1 Tax=Polarella glacialis TaxID=89957 RepID=A0A813JSD8_POLGL|nr:unnamed protein product [Polarella glacialis]|mmetsp:Transcript_30387/g.48684  ORF Transcript_30387/g.48684 Transcript_30387/m.48684 type:complete len:210 (+) Transcript_30387:62-691(+)
MRKLTGTPTPSQNAPCRRSPLLSAALAASAALAVLLHLDLRPGQEESCRTVCRGGPGPKSGRCSSRSQQTAWVSWAAPLPFVCRSGVGAATATLVQRRRQNRGLAAATLMLRRASNEPDNSAMSQRRLPGLAVFAALLSAVTYVLSLDEETRRLKICPRPKEYVDDYLANPKGREFLAKKGIADADMRNYLQDPDCVPLSEFWQRIKPF